MSTAQSGERFPADTPLKSSIDKLISDVPGQFAAMGDTFSQQLGQSTENVSDRIINAHIAGADRLAAVLNSWTPNLPTAVLGAAPAPVDLGNTAVSE